MGVQQATTPLITHLALKSIVKSVELWPLIFLFLYLSGYSKSRQLPDRDTGFSK